MCLISPSRLPLKTTQILLIAWVLSWIPFAAAQESTVPVTVVPVRIAAVNDEIPLSGTVTTRRTVHLSSRVEGYVQEVLVDAGDEVEAGAVIVTLDRRLAEIELSRVRAARAEAKARNDEARRQLSEVMQLVEKQHVAGTTVASAKAEVAIQDAALRRLDTDIVRSRELLQRHTILAPFSGVVSRKLVEVGQWVETSSSLVELSEIERLRVEVGVPQNHFEATQTGTPVTVYFDALPGFILSATVSKKIPIGNSTTRTFPVRIDLDNRDRRIAPGMSANVRLLTNHSPEAMVLPLDAIVREANGDEFVWVVKSVDGVTKGRKTRVTTGRSLDTWIEVNSPDLDAQSKVIVYGNERLDEDQEITIAEELDVAD